MLYPGLKKIFSSYEIYKISDIYDKDNNELEILKNITKKFPKMYIEGEEAWDKLEFIFNEMVKDEQAEKRKNRD